MPETTKNMLSLPNIVRASGDSWKPNDEKPASVPIPNAVITTKIKGPYNERDRKLWVFLIHAVWDDLLTKRYHEISVSKIDKLFRELKSGHDGLKWLWESARRLTKTIVEWEEGPDNARLQGISNLMNAKTNKESQATGVLWFEIPALLSEVIKKPFLFSRIRLHFMIGLSGKYSVTLYEILESVVNMKNPVLEIEVSKLRGWLKVPEGKLQRYIDLKRRAIDPALKQINDNPQKAGFTVTINPIKEGRIVDRIRFSLTKTGLRLAEEIQLSNIRAAAFSALSNTIAPQNTIESTNIGVSENLSVASPRCSNTINLRLDTFEKAKKVAPGFDIYFLEQEWREWVSKKGAIPKNPDAAFIGFCRRKAEKNPVIR